MRRVREQNMQSLLTLLDQGQKDFLTGARGCSFVCSSVMYGALAKQIHSNRFLYWKPEAPFKGFSYQELKGDITLFETPKWYEASTGRRIPNKQHSCEHSASFHFLTAKAPHYIPGLELDQFPSP